MVRRTVAVMTDRTTIWAERAVAWRESGQTSKEFSRGREFTAGGLRHWAHRLHKKPTTQQRRVTSAKAKKSASEAVVRLARVVRQPGEQEVRRQRPASSRPGRVAPVLSPEPGALMLEVGTVRIAVTPNFDRETLAAVLAVLEPGRTR